MYSNQEKKLQKILTGETQLEETDLEISKNTKQNKCRIIPRHIIKI